MKLFYMKMVLVVFLVMVIFQLSGCGETLQGIGKDTTRMGKGIKTIFIRDGE